VLAVAKGAFGVMGGRWPLFVRLQPAGGGRLAAIPGCSPAMLKSGSLGRSG